MKKAIKFFCTLVLALTCTFMLFATPVFAGDFEIEIEIYVRQMDEDGNRVPVREEVTVVIYVDDYYIILTTDDFGEVWYMPELDDVPVVYARIAQADGFYFDTERVRLEPGRSGWDYRFAHIFILESITDADAQAPQPTPAPEPPTSAPTVNGVYIDGQRLQLDVPPTMINNRVLVPLRAIGEALGAEFQWDPEQQRIDISFGDVSVIMGVGGHSVAFVTIDGVQTAHVLDAPPIIINNRTMVPLSFVSEIFGADVDWQAPNAIITTAD